MELNFCDNLQYETAHCEDTCYSAEDLLTKGDDLQKISVIENIPKLLQINNITTLTKILPKIQQELVTSSCEFHLVTSKMFMYLMEKQLPINLIQSVIQGIENKDPIISGAWMDTLLASIPYLPADMIKSQVLPLTISKSQLNRPLIFRLASCKMLGQMAAHPQTTTFDVKKDILPIVQSLMQDCQFEVRATMCSQLPLIAKALGTDPMVKSSLLPGLVELSTDENMSVRSAAVDVMVAIVPYLPENTISTIIIPLFKQVCVNSNEEGNSTYGAIAKVFGKMITSLKASLSTADCVWFLQFFKTLSKRGFHKTFDLDPGMGVMARDYCAYNLPAITFFMMSSIPNQLDNWYGIFQNLASDPCYIVRKTMAGCMHEIMNILGENCKRLKPEIVKLMRDDAEEVINALVPNLGVILELFTIYGLISRDGTSQSTLELGRSLLKCQVELFNGYNWRMQMSYLAQLEGLPNCMPSDFIHQHFTPVMFNIAVDARVRPVRIQACKTILCFLRYNLKEQNRRWIRENFNTRLFQSKSCYTRIIYVYMCHHAMNMFSRRYFKDHFYMNLLTLLEDPVTNIRLTVVNMTPALKDMLVGPLDRMLGTSLDNALSKMGAVETDKDVLAAMKCKMRQMRIVTSPNQDALIEEKRRVDEEERIAQGKNQVDVKTIVVPPKTTLPARSSSAPSKTHIHPTSNMSFLKQHFYIDAGVNLPEETPKRRLSNNFPVTNDEPLLAEIPTVSVENIDNLSESMLRLLENSTTNLTDDVKANLQKINLISQIRPPKENVKRRNLCKRYSSVSSLESNVKPDPAILKRRSLNLIPSDFSKIPVSCRQFHKIEKCDTIETDVPKNENKPKAGVKKKDVSSITKSLDNIYMTDKNVEISAERVSTKENFPLDEGLKKHGCKKNSKEQGAKASNLPVLIRRDRSNSETRK